MGVYYSVGAFVLVVLATTLGSVQAFAPPDVLTASSQSSIHLHSTKPQPIEPSGWPEKFPAKEHCSKCGLCETTFVSHVTDACAFLGDGMARNIDGLEKAVHGRRRNTQDLVWSDISRTDSGIAEEGRFGVMTRPMQLGKGKNVEGAQWTGVVTGIAVSMLESGMVDAVVCIASNDDDGIDNNWSNPQPILARTVDDVLKGRGVKPALAPSLAVLDELKDSKDIKKLLFCGVGCAVQAFRAIQHELQLDEVYVLGTNCADNSPTPEAAKKFLSRSFKDKLDGKRVRGYEFMQDFKVHVKYDDGTEQSQPSYERLPYFSLQGDVAEFAIAKSCLACFDYTNALADVVVGYMGAPLDSSMDASFQTITVRNKMGERILKCAVESDRLQLGPDASGSGPAHEKFASTTVSSDNIVQKMAGGEMKSEGMPRLLGEIMASLMTAAGPKGVNFARYSLDYHILRNYLHVLDVWGEEGANNMIPAYSLEIVKKYLDTDEAFKALAEKIKSKR